MEERKSLTDQELRAQFKTQLDSGRAFVYGVKAVKNGYHQLEVAQQVNTSLDEINMNTIFLGWSSGRILRTWRNVAPEQYAKLIAGCPSPVGMFMRDVAKTGLGVDVEMSIKLVEFTSETDMARYVENVQSRPDESRPNPKRRPTTNETITHNGLPVYSATELVAGEFSLDANYHTLQSDPVGTEMRVQIARPFEDQVAPADTMQSVYVNP